MERIAVGASELGTLAGMLRTVDFFAPLTIGQLETILPHVMLCRYGAGETVFRKGDAGEAFHIVYQGRVDIRLPRFLFPSKTVATLGPGQFFGEIALISAEPRSATVACTEPTLLFTLLASDFAFVLRENPAAAQEMRSIADQRRFAAKHAS